MLHFLKNRIRRVSNYEIQIPFLLHISQIVRYILNLSYSLQYQIGYNTKNDILIWKKTIIIVYL